MRISHAGLGLGILLATAAVAMADPIPSSNPESGNPKAIETGHAAYAKWCLQCHGVEADGLSPRWGKVGADLRKFWRGYTEFVNIVVAGRPKRGMPPWGQVLDAEEIEDIGAYLETLALPSAKWED